MPEESELIDVAKTFPTLHIDLKYATADNITGRPIYQEALCLLHTDAATALAKAISIASLAGLKLVVYDAYRPQQAQAQRTLQRLQTPADRGLGGGHLLRGGRETAAFDDAHKGLQPPHAKGPSGLHLAFRDGQNGPPEGFCHVGTVDEANGEDASYERIKVNALVVAQQL